MRKEQEFTKEVEMCKEIIENQIAYNRVAIENLELYLAEIENVKSKFGFKDEPSKKDHVFMSRYNVETLKKLIMDHEEKINELQQLTPEILAERMHKEYTNHDLIKLYNASCKALTLSEEEIINLPEGERKEVIERKTAIDEELTYDAIVLLKLSEEQANSPEYQQLIADKLKSLKSDALKTYETYLESSKAEKDETFEETVQKELLAIRKKLNYEIGLKRKHSLVQAMGTQSFVDLKTGLGKSVEPAVKLTSWQVEKISKLTEKEYMEMVEELSKKRIIYERMAERRFRTMVRGSKVSETVHNFAGLTAGATLATMLISYVTGNALDPQAVSPEVIETLTRTIPQYTMVAGASGILASVPVELVNGLVDGITRKAGVSVEKAISEYLRDLPNKKDESSEKQPGSNE